MPGIMERDNRAMHLRAVAVLTGEVLMEARCKDWINRTATPCHGNKCCKFSVSTHPMDFLSCSYQESAINSFHELQALPREVEILV